MSTRSPAKSTPVSYLVVQRIRNRIIEVLDLLVSEGEGAVDRPAVKAGPGARDELERWEDWVNEGTIGVVRGPVFAAQEAAAIRKLHETASSLSSRIPAKTAFLILEPQLRACLLVLNRRGRFPETYQLASFPPDGDPAVPARLERTTVFL